MIEIELRLECLRLANMCFYIGHDEVVERAKAYAAYLTGEKTEQAPVKEPHPILAEIREFLAEFKMGKVAFGRDTIGDPNLIWTIEKGSRPQERNLGRIRAQMATYRNHGTFSETLRNAGDKRRGRHIVASRMAAE